MVSVIAGQTHSIQLFRGEVELISTDVYRALFFDAQTFYPSPMDKIPPRNI